MADKLDQVKRIAQDVYRTLGSGFSEDVYDRAMQVGLRLAGIRYESQKVVELTYENHCVGEGYPDSVVHFGGERLVVELKAISGDLGASEEQQLRNYLHLLNAERGLLINFQHPGKKERKTKLEIRVKEEVPNRARPAERAARVDPRLHLCVQLARFGASRSPFQR